ncbi:MAG: hypothetical protein K2H09_01400 [Treponemataceae bacterium]|nr:hypothetical protein [Treponemataceae bacterium]
MTEEQKSKCHAIIHSHAVLAGAGNVILVPGLGVAADIGTMTTMAMALSGVFGGGIGKEVAKNIATATLKRTVLKQPIKTAAKELSKLIPGLGQIVAPSISVTMLEAAGWAMAHQFEKETGN